MDAAILKETVGWEPECGNAQIDWLGDSWELCDRSNVGRVTCEALGYVDGTLWCSDDCQSYDTSDCVSDGACGNGLLDEGESCDDGPAPEQVCPEYSERCVVCTTECTLVDGVVSVCGDGVRAEAHEVCDGDAMAANSCENQGFPAGGTLRCADDCQSFDASECLGDQCGDGVIGETEACEINGPFNRLCDYGERACTLCNPRCQLIEGTARYCGDGVVEYHNMERCEIGQSYVSACSGDTIACLPICVWEPDPCAEWGYDAGSEDTALEADTRAGDVGSTTADDAGGEGDNDGGESGARAALGGGRGCSAAWSAGPFSVWSALRCSVLLALLWALRCFPLGVLGSRLPRAFGNR